MKGKKDPFAAAEAKAKQRGSGGGGGNGGGGGGSGGGKPVNRDLACKRLCSSPWQPLGLGCF